MVDRERIDVVMSTIAVLTAASRTSVVVDQKNLEQVMTRPLSVVKTANGLMVSSQRDQIEAIISVNRIEIRDLSGKKDFSGSKLPPVLDYFIRLCETQPTSYGINFVITAPCIRPDEWICNNILSSEISGKTGKRLLGGDANLKFESENKVLKIRIVPVEGDMISVNFNASQAISQIPEQLGLTRELTDQFSNLLGFLTSLGL